MDAKTLASLLINTLDKYHFKNYGPKLFYRDLPDCILILEQTNYNTAAEIYLRVIIKECHPEVQKITKNVLKDKMLIDTYNYDKLIFSTSNTIHGFDYNLYSIPVDDFDAKIHQIYESFICGFEKGVVAGINTYNQFYEKDMPSWMKRRMNLFKDSAEKIGHREFAAERGHDWYLSDEYILENVYGIDNRFLNHNTAQYIMKNVIPHIPKDLKGKAVSKWCDQQCKEIFLAKGKRFFLGWGLPFPFLDGKPLKYCGPNTDPNGKTRLIYLNEDTNEMFSYTLMKDNEQDRSKDEYEIIKLR